MYEPNFHVFVYDGEEISEIWHDGQRLGLNLRDGLPPILSTVMKLIIEEGVIH